MKKEKTSSAPTGTDHATLQTISIMKQAAEEVEGITITIQDTRNDGLPSAEGYRFVTVTTKPNSAIQQFWDRVEELKKDPEKFDKGQERYLFNEALSKSGQRWAQMRKNQEKME